MHLEDLDAGDGETCSACGEPREVEILEWWPADRGFLLWTCCETVEEEARAALRGLDRRAAAEWIRRQTGERARRLFEEVDLLRVDFGLEAEPITLADAKAFVLEHHEHNAPPCGWRFGFGLRNGPDLVGVVMAGRPVARMLQRLGTVVEVNRVCVRRDLSPALTWNGCSMLYGAAVREARRKGFLRVVTYTLETENGASLRAAGFVPVARSRGGSWNRKGRPREDVAPTCPKVRWERAA